MKELTFEEAFVRLEKILDTMNEGNLPLEESIKLFEEGNKLVTFCDQYLHSAEQKVEKLLKDRNDELILDENKEPICEPFSEESADKDSCLWFLKKLPLPRI